MRPQTGLQEEKQEQTEEEDRINEEEVTVVLRRPATSRGSQGSLQKKKRLSTKDNGVKSRNEYLQWLQEYKEERRGKEIGEVRGIPQRKNESTRGNAKGSEGPQATVNYCTCLAVA